MQDLGCMPPAGARCPTNRIGLRDTHIWSEADRALFQAVGQSLNLALKRTETARADCTER